MTTIALQQLGGGRLRFPTKTWWKLHDHPELKPIVIIMALSASIVAVTAMTMICISHSPLDLLHYGAVLLQETL
jgi:hypothetical protein